MVGRSEVLRRLVGGTALPFEVLYVMRLRVCGGNLWAMGNFRELSSDSPANH